MFETNDKKEADSSEPEPESAEPESDYREWIPRILGGVHFAKARQPDSNVLLAH